MKIGATPMSGGESSVPASPAARATAHTATRDGRTPDAAGRPLDAGPAADGRPKRTKLTAAFMTRLRKLAREGCTSAEIADALGCHIETVRRAAGNHGISLQRPRGIPRPLDTKGLALAKASLAAVCRAARAEAAATPPYRCRPEDMIQIRGR